MNNPDLIIVGESKPEEKKPEPRGFIRIYTEIDGKPVNACFRVNTSWAANLIASTIAQGWPPCEQFRPVKFKEGDK